MTKQRFIKVIPLVAVITVTSSILVLLSALMISSRTANTIAQEQTTSMIDTELQAEDRKLQAAVLSLSVGKAAFQQAQLRDVAWAKGEIRSRTDAGQFDVLETHWQQDNQILAWDAADGSTAETSIIPSALVDLALSELSNQTDYDRKVYTAMAEIDGQPALIAAARVEPITLPVNSAPKLFPVNFLVSFISDNDISNVGSRLHISGLRFTQTPEAGQSFKPVLDYSGQVIGNLAWTPLKPGADLVRALLPLFIGTVLISIGFAWYVGNVAQKIADKLKESVSKQAKLARRDFLTGLPNRFAFQEHTTEILDGPQGETAMITADINGFKNVNDNHGHAAGDRLILGVAERIRDAVHPDVFVARVGGDEFCFLLTGPDAVERLTGAADSLKNALEPAFYLDGSPFFLSMSMGLAVCPADADLSMDELTRQSDEAMYSSKSMASHMLVRYDANIDPDRVKELKLETELRAALETPEQFSLKYQPIINSSDCRVDLAEALIRWDSPSLGSVSPGDFIPVAESTGLIRHLTSMVLDMVCADLASEPDMRVSINISPIEISDPQFHDDIAKKVKRYAVDPDRIVIELTEGVLIENPRGLAASLQKLRLLGHQVALDDFGTGYSSIGYLRQMEFSLLKVDKSLIDGVTHNKQARDVLSATLKLAKAIGVRVLAEGVETKAQAKLLRDMGFDFQQGFNFSAGLGFNELMDYAHEQDVDEAKVA